MASVFEKRGKAGQWYAKYKDEKGKWRDRALPSGIRKAEALRLAHEIEHRFWRVEQGLDVVAVPTTMTVADLMQWWLKHESPRTVSHDRNISYVRCHFTDNDFVRLPLPDVTPGKVEVFLREREEKVSRATCNHIRMFLHRAYRAARAAEVYAGPNPAADVRRRKVPQRKPDFLLPHEVMALLSALAPRWRPLFATAIYTGLRKGELLGLMKEDVRLAAKLIHVRHSHGRDTTKGGREDIVPIAGELVPFLEVAIATSPSKLVFPAQTGERMREDSDLESVLRMALARGGIHEGFEHVCRKKSCTYSVHAPDSELRHCPEHGWKLWPKAKLRKIRFHDLRHTCASLLVMQGADLAAVSRILRHTDPKLTLMTYAHLTPNYLRDQIDRLHFFGPSQSSACGHTERVANLWPVATPGDNRATGSGEKQLAVQDSLKARPAGLEPATVGLEVLRNGIKLPDVVKHFNAVAVA